MTSDRRNALAALTGAGILWGTTVPLTKVALEWLPPTWLTVARFAPAAVILLVVARHRLRAAWTPAIFLSGALGYGVTILVQNVGVTRTSVAHAALLVGATPVVVAVVSACLGRGLVRPLAWAGFAVSLGGVGIVAGGGGGGGTTLAGDAIVFASVVLSAAFMVVQPRLLAGRDAVAVTGVQFAGAAVVALLFAMPTPVPRPAGGAGVLVATCALAAATLLPFTLFAYGQARVSAVLAGAFVNVEPLVGAVAGVVFFADPIGLLQTAGGAAILLGIALSSLQLLRSESESSSLPPQRVPLPSDLRVRHASGWW